MTGGSYKPIRRDTLPVGVHNCHVCAYFPDDKDRECVTTPCRDTPLGSVFFVEDTPEWEVELVVKIARVVMGVKDNN